jgi:hypothetical protein
MLGGPESRIRHHPAREARPCHAGDAVWVRLAETGTGRFGCGRHTGAPRTLGGCGPDRKRRAHSHRADPNWVKTSLDVWTAAAGISEGKIFRVVARMDKVWGDGISQNVVWYVVKSCCEKAGLQHIAPHDLQHLCEAVPHKRRRDRADSIPTRPCLGADYGTLPRLQAEPRASSERPIPTREHSPSGASEFRPRNGGQSGENE